MIYTEIGITLYAGYIFKKRVMFSGLWQRSVFEVGWLMEDEKVGIVCIDNASEQLAHVRGRERTVAWMGGGTEEF